MKGGRALPQSKTQAQSPLPVGPPRIWVRCADRPQKNFAFPEKQAFVRLNTPPGHNQRVARFRIGNNESGKLKRRSNFGAGAG